LLKNAISRIYLIDIEFKKPHNYMLFNCDELKPFV
jgi:hypothetical protein